MQRIRRLSAVLLLLAFGVPEVCAAAVPRGFSKVASAPGVTLYKKRHDYVQVVDPSKGARIEILHGDVLPQGSHATFPRRDIGEWWSEWKAGEVQAFSVINGQFFNPQDPAAAPLAFSIKANGVVYQGYGDKTEYPMKKKMLVLSDGRTLMMDYDDDPKTLSRMAAPDIVVGLSPNASKALARPLPRTFLGLTKEGKLLIFSSSMASQLSADRILRMFGADPEQTMMLDGGSSSHLIHAGKMLVPAGRAGRERLPQILGITAGGREVTKK